MRDEPSPSQSGLCAEYRERLPLYVGGDLDSTELDAIARHLAGCETCAAEAARASGARNAFVDSLQGWRSEFATEEGRAELWPSIRDRLVAEGLLESDTLRLVSPVSSRRRLRLLRPAGLVAAAAAIIFLVVPADPLGLRENDESFTPFEGSGTSGIVANEILEPAPVRVPASTGGMLRRVADEEATELDAAEPDSRLRRVSPIGTRPNRGSGSALAGQSGSPGYR